LDGEFDIHGIILQLSLLQCDGGITAATTKAKQSRGAWIKGNTSCTYPGAGETILIGRKLRFG